MKYPVLILSLCLAVLSCGRGGKDAGDGSRSFPLVSVPSMLTDPGQRTAYIIDHYWDGFLAGGGPTDSGRVLGVRRSELEENMSAYLALLYTIDVPDAADAVSSLFDKIEARQARDSAGLVYESMTGLVSAYLYDPNSILRSEDLYLPFVTKMLSSPYTSRDKIGAYRFEAEKCAMNPYGSKAPDFEFKDVAGKVHRLYDIRADWTMLFFSNPGCQSCRSIVDAIVRAGFPADMVSRGELAVVNIYIDDEIEKWRDSASSYPSDWYNGYDFRKVMNDGSLYYVRAIPSLYLLDAEKRVVMKDAPLERVLSFLETESFPDTEQTN